MPRRKVVLVIVEGPSDELALGMFLKKLYDENIVRVQIYRGDITTEKGNIKKLIGDVVHNYSQSYHLSKKDYQEVIHIVDMDGAYVNEDAIRYDINAVKPIYLLDQIKTINPQGIVARNSIKKKNIDIISKMDYVCQDIPYRVYFMSSNLEHVLHDRLNCSDEEKEEMAYEFVRTYKDNYEGFISFISNSSFCVKGTYAESWDYIKKDKHSLERHTNLGICFKHGMNQ